MLRNKGRDRGECIQMNNRWRRMTGRKHPKRALCNICPWVRGVVATALFIRNLTPSLLGHPPRIIIPGANPCRDRTKLALSTASGPAAPLCKKGVQVRKQVLLRLFLSLPHRKTELMPISVSYVITVVLPKLHCPEHLLGDSPSEQGLGTELHSGAISHY